jgi:hypothetical protein
MGPEIDSDGAWPTLIGMDELGAPLLLKQPDSLLCLSVLVTRIDPSKRESLPLFNASCLPLMGVEDLIVSMAWHGMAWQCSASTPCEVEHASKAFLASTACLLCGGSLLQSCKGQFRKVVQKDCCTAVPLLGQEARHLGAGKEFKQSQALAS